MNILLWFIVCDRVFQNNTSKVKATYSNILHRENWAPFIVTWKSTKFAYIGVQILFWFTSKQDDIEWPYLDSKAVNAHHWLPINVCDPCFYKIPIASYAPQHTLMQHRCLKRGSNIVEVHPIDFNMCLFQLKGKPGRRCLARTTQTCSTIKKNGKYFKEYRHCNWMWRL